ncbi:MAG: rubredoxin [Candidatus Methanomethylophilaceae archaeon]|jgi:rubredoxin
MKYECLLCGYIYDEEKEGVPFNELPDDWVCPSCGASKSDFQYCED